MRARQAAANAKAATSSAAPVSARGPTSVRDGAASSAPTAPHATDAGEGASTSGPARFWDRKRIARISILTYIVSFAIHYAVAPFSLLPEASLDLVDVEGEISIPIDLLEEPLKADEPAQPTNPNADPTNGAAQKGPGNDAGLDAATDADTDAGMLVDAAKPIRDASVVEAGIKLGASDAGDDGDGGVLALGDAGAGNGAKGLLGAASDVQAGPVNVQLLVNMEEIRKHPTGATLGPILSAIPQWDSFFNGTNVDPIKDTDWLSIIGPSLRNTDRDVILVRYSASDAVIDKAIDTVTTQYAHGGPFDAGVKGMKAAIGTADRSQRVFLRPQSHLVAVVPPDFAGTAARMLSKTKVPAHVIPKEVFHLVLKDPKKHVPQLPAGLTEARVWGVPRADYGVDLIGEADAADPEKAEAAAEEIRQLIRRLDSMGTRFVIGGVLGGFDCKSEGSKVKVKLPVDKATIDILVRLAGGRLGAKLPPP